MTTSVEPKTRGVNLEQSYWQDIQHSEPLVREEETQLARQARAGDEQAMQRLVLANLRFVVSIARQYTGCGLSLMECISEGNMGLLEAANRFDASRGTRFITYAVWWIRQSILKALAEHGRVTRLPMSQIGDWRRIEKELDELTQELGREPTLEELTASTQLSDTRAYHALEAGKPPVSFDAPCFRDGEEALVETFAAPEADSAAALDRVELVEVLQKSLACLDDREQTVVRAYFGLEEQEPMTLQEIGDALGLTRERVRQLRNAALRKMRQHFGDVLIDYCSSD
jgi:RNA polymerase primary sigma factor